MYSYDFDTTYSKKFHGIKIRNIHVTHLNNFVIFIFTGMFLHREEDSAH